MIILFIPPPFSPPRPDLPLNLQGGGGRRGVWTRKAPTRTLPPGDLLIHAGAGHRSLRLNPHRCDGHCGCLIGCQAVGGLRPSAPRRAHRAGRVRGRRGYDRVPDPPISHEARREATRTEPSPPCPMPGAIHPGPRPVPPATSTGSGTARAPSGRGSSPTLPPGWPGSRSPTRSSSRGPRPLSPPYTRMVVLPAMPRRDRHRQAGLRRPPNFQRSAIRFFGRSLTASFFSISQFFPTHQPI